MSAKFWKLAMSRADGRMGKVGVHGNVSHCHLWHLRYLLTLFLIQPDSSDVDQVTSSMVLGIKVLHKQLY